MRFGIKKKKNCTYFLCILVSSWSTHFAYVLVFSWSTFSSFLVLRSSCLFLRELLVTGSVGLHSFGILQKNASFVLVQSSPHFALTEIFLVKFSHNFPLVELYALVTHCWMRSFVFSFQSMKKVWQNVLQFLLDLNFQGFLKLLLEHHSYHQ